MSYKKRILIVIALVALVLLYIPERLRAAEAPDAWASSSLSEPQGGSDSERPAPELVARAAVLMEAETGIVVFGYDEHERMYPAGLTSILTALVVLDHFEPNDVIIAGEEIERIRYDAARTWHTIGEENTVLNLLRASFFTGGNDSANILAMAVARRVLEDDNINFAAAERLFAELMNEKARGLGAFNSNFVNPHGYPNRHHFTTAYDMALIVREALNVPIIRQIGSETRFTRPQRSWNTPNQLIIPASDYFYPYATGMRTGRTSLAGDVLAATALQDEVQLIAIISNSEDPGRFLDAAALFEYGFNNFFHINIAEEGDLAGKINVYNPRRQDSYNMHFLLTAPFRGFFSQGQLSRMEREVVFEMSLTGYDEDGGLLLLPPIEEGQVIGRVVYTVDGRTVYDHPVIAMYGAQSRTLSTDVEYFAGRIVSIFFTRAAVPYWIIAGLTLLILGYIIYTQVRKKRRATWRYR